MAVMRDLSRSQLVFQVSGQAADVFEVIRFRGTEGLCQLYRFEIELASTAADMAFDTIVGQPAVLSINATGGEQWFHGIVSRFEVSGGNVAETHYRVELVPGIWLLTHRYSSRIFQNKTTVQIVTDVLTQAGIASDRFRFTVSGSYEPREYCVQYRETDHNFICRLLEEEGIWWCFEQTADAHVLVMGDATSAYQTIEGETKLPFQPPTGLSITDEHVFRFRLSQCVRPGAVALRDFSFENPKLDLQAKTDAGRDTELEFSDFPGEYKQQSAGASLARIRMEEFESCRIIGTGQSNSHRLHPGRVFELDEHPSAPFNRSYLVTSVTHQGKQSVTRTSTGGNGQSSLLDARVYQSLVAARQNENAVIRELAEGLLQMASRFQAGDPTSHHALTQWLYHAGQVSRDLSSVAAASGGSPLEALAISNLIEDVARSSLIDYDAPVYESRFECIPSEVAYRPPRITPWPVMRGSQTARVVGPQGEEIYTDEYGRVKVQFPWDRQGKFDENASCWIRVAHGMAGGSYGMLFLPRIGQEVVVDFLEGDPDQPMIVGRVYNADHMPPYELPKEKTKSCIKTHSSKGGGGTNEIRFEDLKDSEQILIHAQKDFHLRVTNNSMENVESDRSLTVANDKIEEVGRDKSVHVKGKESYKVDGTLSVTCGGDVVQKLGANHKHEVQMTYAAKALSIKLEATTGIELKCGGSSIVLTPAAIFIVGGPLVNINSGSGPPVSPVTASATSPVAPSAADDVTPGKDTTYGGGEDVEDAEAEEAAGHEFETDESPETETSWIEIELVDEADMPVPSEPYELKLPDGKIRKGSLDANGVARVEGIEPGTCQICFPKLDSAAWERI